MGNKQGKAGGGRGPGTFVPTVYNNQGAGLTDLNVSTGSAPQTPPTGGTQAANASTGAQTPPTAGAPAARKSEPFDLRGGAISVAFANVPKARLYVSIAAYTDMRADDDLSFTKGELLEIINWDDDPNWWYARNDKGKTGWVPSTFITQCESLETYSWFQGKIPRIKAEKKLRNQIDGTFLIRESEQNPGDYTISMVYELKVYHYHVRKINHTRFYLCDPDASFHSLGKLVDFHSKNMGGLHYFLLYPATRDAVEIEIYGTSDTKDKWELKKDEIQLDEKIGSGQYGDVYKGKWRNIKVAVKQLKAIGKSDNNWIKEFKMESGIMKKLHHPNLVQLLGVCTESQPYYIVTELLVKKSLLEFLRSVEGRSTLDATSLLVMSMQVCSAMVYLEEHNYIHRDLAARNCLVAADNTVKVADFGLSRLVDGGNNYYMASEGAKFPIKWTAPEALEYSKFTSCSDVWSFGILLWEISSLGKVPYPDTELSEVINRIRSGYRLHCPSGCPNEVYQVMLKCWEYNAADRPTFKAIKQMLSQIQEDSAPEMSIMDMIQGNRGPSPATAHTSAPMTPVKASSKAAATAASPPSVRRVTKSKWMAMCTLVKDKINNVVAVQGSKEANNELIVRSSELLKLSLAAAEELGQNLDQEARNDVNEIIVYLTSHVSYAEKSIHMWTKHERMSALQNFFRVVTDTEETLGCRLNWDQ